MSSKNIINKISSMDHLITGLIKSYNNLPDNDPCEIVLYRNIKEAEDKLKRLDLKLRNSGQSQLFKRKGVCYE